MFQGNADSVFSNRFISVEVQTILTCADIERMDQVLQECNTKLYNLTAEVAAKTLNQETFKGNDMKTSYFTGFPTAHLLFLVFSTLEPHLPQHHNSALSKFHQFLLTMMRLRLNLPYKYLSFVFDVACSTSSQTFYTCILIMYEHFKEFVVWPEWENLRATMPLLFINDK